MIIILILAITYVLTYAFFILKYCAVQNNVDTGFYPFEIDTCPQLSEMLNQAKKEAYADKLHLAKRALEAIPDVSSDSVAKALNISPHAVRAVTKRSKVKRQKHSSCGYSKEEILSSI